MNALKFNEGFETIGLYSLSLLYKQEGGGKYLKKYMQLFIYLLYLLHTPRHILFPIMTVTLKENEGKRTSDYFNA